MTDRDDTNGNGTNESPWRRLFNRGGQPQTELEAEVRERFEKDGAEIVNRLLGCPIKEDGTPDVSGVTQEQLDASMPELAIELLKAYMKAIKPALQEQRAKRNEVKQADAEGDEPTEEDDDDAFYANAAEDIRLVLSLFGTRPGGFGTTFDEILTGVKDSLGEQVGEMLKKVNFAKEMFDPESFNKDAIRRVLADKIIALVRKMGDAVQSARTPPPGSLAEEAARERTARVREAESGTDVADDLDEDLDDDEGGEVIILEDVRRKLEEKRKQLEGLPDILSRFLVNTGATDETEGVNINLDQDFFKDHGPALFKQLFDGLSKTLIPPKVELNLPMTPGEQKAEQKTEQTRAKAEGSVEGGAESKDAEDSAVKVSVNLDLGSILGRIFRARETGKDES